MDRKELMNELKSVFRSYIDAKPNRNASALAQKAGVGEATIRRALNGQAIPSAQNLLKLLGVVSGLKTVHELRAFYGANISSFLEVSFPELANAPEEVQENTPELFRRFPEAYFVYKFVRDKMPSLNEIREEFGKIGERATVALLREALVSERGTKLMAVRENEINPDSVVNWCIETESSLFKIDRLSAENEIKVKSRLRDFVQTELKELMVR